MTLTVFILAVIIKIDMKVIIATAISGSGRKDYLNRFEEYAKRFGKNVKIFHVGEMMLEHAKQIGLHITKENVLNTNQNVLRSLRSAVFENVLSELKDGKNKYDAAIISLHGFFYWKKTFHRSYDQFYINQFNPSLFITLIDHAQDIKISLSKRKQWIKQRLTIQEIMLWQNVETEAVASWAEMIGKTFYTFYASQPLSTFYKLVFLPEFEPIYISMPITHMREPKQKKRVLELIKKLEEFFVVFVPEEIKGGLPPLYKKGVNPIVSHHAVKIDIDWLIHQSRKIIAFYPKVVSSPGLNNEIREAHENNKEVWMIYPGEYASPFLAYYVDRFFKDEREFLTFLKKYYKGFKRFTHSLN